MPTNAPASTPRNATAAGTPARKVPVPAGSSRYSPYSMATRPSAAATRLGAFWCSPASATPAMPTAVSTANHTRLVAGRHVRAAAAQPANRR